MKSKIYISIQKFIVAFILCLIAVPVSRYISPRAIIDSNYVYLAWLPLSVTLAMMLLLGRHAILPIIISFAIVNEWLLSLPFNQAVILLFCQTFPVFAVCAMVRWKIGIRWRYGIPNKNMALRIFWMGFVAPAGIKFSMYLAGKWFAFPVYLSSYFGSASVVYSIVDIQSLICASLIFTMMFYYPLRMIVSPHYGRIFWRKSLKPCFSKKRRLFISLWVFSLISILTILCAPYHSDFVAGYLVPLIFILFTLGISKLSYPLIMLSWAVSAFVLAACNRNFLHGVNTEYSLAFVMSVLICFTICLIYMTRVYHRSVWIRKRWRAQALTDPLTGLPNLRALELHLEKNKNQTICCFHMKNLEFLSRHYGMMMRIYFKRSVTHALRPLLQPTELLFQLPGSELLLVLEGSQAADRLQHMLDYLNSQRFHWQNTALDVEFGASWGDVNGAGETLHPMLGQLSWLSEQACTTPQALALTHSLDVVSDQMTERVILLNKVKRALDECTLQLYAQPILDAQGEGYHEILTRLVSDGDVMNPAHFIPVIAQFNLSTRFDMQVIETLLQWMQANPQSRTEPRQRFSVNLMPLTLMQKHFAEKLLGLFKHYAISTREIIIEITEEQAFSHSEYSVQNIQQLRQAGFKIAIDDFGTGFANFERLKRLEADIIKIDGCFVRDIAHDPQDAMIVKSICDLAKAKSLTVVAEYVETQEQRALLLNAGVDYLQGYLLGKPQPLAAVGKE
ncbi:TPA: EAL domain-containing protein [Kluyvera intermedia]|nr:EAL domain-containing protein [Kluyvera intermedia]